MLTGCLQQVVQSVSVNSAPNEVSKIEFNVELQYRHGGTELLYDRGQHSLPMLWPNVHAYLCRARFMYLCILKHAKEPLVLHAPLPMHFWFQRDQHWQGENLASNSGIIVLCSVRSVQHTYTLHTCCLLWWRCCKPEHTAQPYLIDLMYVRIWSWPLAWLTNLPWSSFCQSSQPCCLAKLAASWYICKVGNESYKTAFWCLTRCVSACHSLTWSDTTCKHPHSNNFLFALYHCL